MSIHLKYFSCKDFCYFYQKKPQCKFLTKKIKERAVRPGGKSDSELKEEQQKVGQKFPRLLCHLRKIHQGHWGVLTLARVNH